MAIVGYGVFYEHDNVLKAAALPCAATREGGDALLLVFRLQYKSLSEGARVLEIREPESTLKEQLEESLRIEEVPDEA